ncbi:uncharacterized protein LOC132194899 [Neocloeon triangulifer]|uniref:uncharacterized protein LOC132194899 n=1 Tax=Neocloeon triangulifer TaxID=2078957 RepID=UPI00286F61A4|nr:uncharacterized protein LOC132194899 [Neocloeon triangulifer]XP_059472475.1 uncharacterized protein LOC132194899 [Neocloeon triangulifer]
MRNKSHLLILKFIFLGLSLGVIAIVYYIISNDSGSVIKIQNEHDKPALSAREEVLDIDDTIFTEDLKKIMLEKSHPNIFVAHLDEGGPQINATCAHYINALDIEYNNIYWQKQKTINETYYFYGAYYDNRVLVDGNVIRIVGMVDKLDPGELYCQIWYTNEPQPIISKVHHAQYMWYTYWGYQNAALQPYLWSCRIPDEFQSRVPESVSLVGHPCQNPSNNLRVVYNLPESGEKENFAVCVKGLNFMHSAHTSVRLIEWIELLKMLGASKIIFYELATHANISKVLDYYSRTRNVEVIKTTLPGPYANIPEFMGTFLQKRLQVQIFQEMIQYNDCFYQNFHKFKYITLLDLDEVILPLSVKTWHELIFNVSLPKAVAAKNITYASFIARNVHFMDDRKEYNDWFPDIPQYMHMLQHVLRNTKHVPPGEGIKAFHNTDLILSLHNHFARACIASDTFWCDYYDFDLKDAHLQHYCSGRNKEECMTTREGNLTLDTSMWRYKNELIDAVRETLHKTGFLK